MNTEYLSVVMVSMAGLIYNAIKAGFLVENASETHPLVIDAMKIRIASLRPVQLEAIKGAYGEIPPGINTVGEFVSMRSEALRNIMSDY